MTAKYLVRFGSLGYLAVILLAPVGLIFYRAFENGLDPVWKTLSPSLVTSRSSCTVLRRCACTVAIFNRHEFDPISIAANVGIPDLVPLLLQSDPRASYREESAAA